MTQPGIEGHRDRDPQRSRLADLAQGVDPAEVHRGGAGEIGVGGRLEADVHIAAILLGPVSDLARPVEDDAAVIGMLAATHADGRPGLGDRLRRRVGRQVEDRHRRFGRRGRIGRKV